MKKTESVFLYGHLWEKGSREINEDSLAFWHMKKGKQHRIMAILCDGIGGLQQGEQASSYVIRQMVGWFMTQGYKIRKRKTLEKMLQQLCYQIHEELKAYGKETGIRLGTTMTMLMLENKRFLWVHYGDCRLYFFRKGKMWQLTKDDCEKSGAINRAIGVGEWYLPQIKSGKIRTGDSFLLCSDGFYRKLDIEILHILGKRKKSEEKQIERMLKQIYEKKIFMGEKDNISALYIEVRKKNKGEIR